MSKYLKAILLVLLTAAPVIFLLMLTFGEETTPDSDTADNADYIVADENNESTNTNTPQVTMLTLGGMWISPEVMLEVQRFNRENEHYQIQVETVDFFAGGNQSEGMTSDRIDTEQAGWHSFDMLLENYELTRHYSITTADLYTLIDADPELNREDFFPNVLTALEAPDGTLPFISPAFGIETMIAKSEVAEQITPLTFENLLRRLEQPLAPQISTTWLPWDYIIYNAIRYSGNYFLDFERGLANFYNDEFITVLNLVAHTHMWQEAAEEDFRLSAEYRRERLYSGEILLFPFILRDLNALRAYHAGLGEIVATGVPSATGGRHILRTIGRIGINAESPHQEIAWNFVRRLLLPTFNVCPHSELPLRIDLFEARIAELVMPHIDRDGVEFPAMTEAEAKTVREIAENAVPTMRVDWEIYAIVIDEAIIFLKGERSAEEAARIIQERVQEFLDEV